MRQIQMMGIADRLPEGKSICISGRDMRDAAGGDLSMLDGPVMDSDVTAYIAQISTNWGVRITYDHFRDVYTMHKLPNRDVSGSRTASQKGTES